MPDRPILDLQQLQTRTETPFNGVLALGCTKAPVKGKRLAPRRAADTVALTLTATQIAQYRQRLERGFYSAPQVLREVARRILEEDVL